MNRKGGRRPKKTPPEMLAKVYRDYDEGALTVDEIMAKYHLSRYMFYKLMRERSEANATETQV